jgi:protein-S-isoprenylcysteine O-methyltransferase Ste14
MTGLELKVPPMGLALMLALAMWATEALTPSLVILLPWHHVLGATVFAVGVLFILAAGATFRAQRTTVNPTKPDATSSLVISGVYRLSRNPMYVGALFALGGWAVFLSHPLPFLFLPFFFAYMNRFQIAPEERVLSSKFGADYETYKKAVRRWL